MDLFDIVRITKDDAEKGVIRGQIGTIVDMSSDGQFEIEICNNDGMPIFFGVLPKDYLELV